MLKERYSLEELEEMETISIGQADNLKVETEDTRIWLCRCGIDDGMPYDNQVTVEKLDKNDYIWKEIETYQAL